MCFFAHAVCVDAHMQHSSTASLSKCKGRVKVKEDLVTISGVLVPSRGVEELVKVEEGGCTL